MAAAATEEPVLSRLERLDNMLKQLEEFRGRGGGGGGFHSPKSSTASTPSSGTLTSDGHASSTDFSPKSLEKHCRPIDDVILETEIKGTLLDRLVQVEDRVFKLCLRIGKELEAEKNREERVQIMPQKSSSSSKKGFKHFVKTCVKGERKEDKSQELVNSGREKAGS